MTRHLSPALVVFALAGCARVAAAPLPDLEPCPDQPNAVCWTSLTRPTEASRLLAETERNDAIARRAASAALAAAELTACSEVTEQDRDQSPFDHTEDIVEVSAIKDYLPSSLGYVPHPQLAGAVIAFRALRGMTEQRLQRILDCHLARGAAVADTLPEGPLALPGIAARVVPDGDRFNVELRATHAATAREVLARAQKLTASASR